MNGLLDAGALLSEWCRSILRGGIGVAFLTTLLLGLGLLAGSLARRRGAALQSLIYQATLLGVLAATPTLLLLAGHLPPLWKVPRPAVAAHGSQLLSRLEPPIREALPGASPTVQTGLFGDNRTHSPTLEPPTGTGSRSDTLAAGDGTTSPPEARGLSAERLHGGFFVALVGLWIAGTALLLLRLLVCRLRLERLIRSGTRVSDASAQTTAAELSRAIGVRPPALLASDRVASPFLTGMRHPTILLPAEYDRQLDGAMLRAVVAHELVHLKRGDCAWNLLARLVCAVGWMQPLLWLLCRRLELASEDLCDMEVVRLEGNPRGYAACLLSLARELQPAAPERTLGVGVVSFRSSLGQRIQKILEGGRQHARPLSSRLRAVVAMGASLVVLFGVLLTAAVADPLDASGTRPAAPLGPAARDTGERDRHVLDSLRELDRPVTYTETQIPLGELVQKIAAATGAPLVAAPEVADEAVAVVVKDLPARTLLVQLAEMLDYLWSRQGKEGAWRYEIWQDLASRSREEALRQKAFAEVERRLTEEVRRFADVAALPPQQIQALAEQHQRWRDRMIQLPPAQRVVISLKEGRQMKRASIASRLRSPVNRTLALLLGRLSPEQWAAMRQGRAFFFSTDPGRGEQLLSTESAQAFRAARPSMDDTWRYGNAEVAEREREKQRNMETEWAAAAGYRVTLRMDTQRLQRQGLLTLRAYAAPLRPTAAPASAYAQGQGTSLQLFAEASDTPSRAEEDASKRQASLENDSLLGAHKRFQRQPKLKPAPESSRPTGFTPLPELLPDLARSCDLNLIANSYNADRTSFPIPGSEPTPVYALLDQITHYGYQWERKGALIQIRHRAWFFMRPRSVPLRVVRHWNRILDGTTMPRLAEHAATAAMLNNDQLELLTSLLHRGSRSLRHEPSFSMPTARHALRLYASLTPLQQQALWRGQPLPATAMTPAQRELFLAPWRDRQEATAGEEPSPETAALTASPLSPESHLTMTVERGTLIVEKRGDSTHFEWEPASGPSPTTPTSGTRAARTSGTPSAVGATRGPRLPSPVTNTKARHALARVIFRFEYGPGLSDATQVSVAPDSAPALSSTPNGRPPSVSDGSVESPPQGE